MIAEISTRVTFVMEAELGRSVYFAENASYLNKYAHLTLEHNWQPDRTISKPPLKPSQTGSANSLLLDERYDSVKRHSKGSEVYVIYDHDKACVS